MADAGDGSTEIDPRPSARRRSRAGYSAVAVALTVLATVLSGVLAVPAVLLGPTLGTLVLAVALAEGGYALTAVGFALLSGRGVAWLDLGRLVARRRFLVYVLGGALVLFTFRSVTLAGAAALDVPFAPPRLTDTGFDTRGFALALIPLSLFVVAPCEELFFRGVLQRYLGETFSTTGAILGAGVLFGLVHLPSYLAYSALGAAVSLFVVFVVGLGFGYLYERTGSLWVAVGVHGVYNALIMASALVLAELGYVAL
jgi:membrane protease YdiL (CAAX protease family)